MLELVPLAASLISTVVPELIHIFGTDKQKEVADAVMNVAKKVTGKDNPDEAAAAINASPEAALKFKEAVLQQQIDLEALSIKREELYLADVQDARRYRDDRVFYLGVIILLSFVVVMSVSLYGLYEVAIGKVEVAPGVLATVTGLLGAITGYFASNAQQVVGFFFGSSQGSQNKSDDIADTLKVLKQNGVQQSL